MIDIKTFNKEVKFVKAKTGKTYKQLAAQWKIGERHLRKLRSGEAQLKGKSILRIHKSYKSYKKQYWLLITIAGISKVIHGEKELLLTKKALSNMITKISERKQFEVFLLIEKYHQGTKNRFKIADWRRIAQTDFTEEGEIIFYNRNDFLGDLLLQLSKKEQVIANEEIWDYYSAED